MDPLGFGLENFDAIGRWREKDAGDKPIDAVGTLPTGESVNGPAELRADVRNGVWGELNSPKVTIDAYRRNLQRAFLDIANNKLNATAQAAPQGLPRGFAALFISSGDEKAFYRSELRSISTSANAALARTTDRATRVHLESVRDQISNILDPEKSGKTGTTAINEEAMRLLELYYNPTSCWPDYVVNP
jgi:hypothetical protein